MIEGRTEIRGMMPVYRRWHWQRDSPLRRLVLAVFDCCYCYCYCYCYSWWQVIVESCCCYEKVCFVMVVLLSALDMKSKCHGVTTE